MSMIHERQPPILVQPIPKQRVPVGKAFRLDLNDYIRDSDEGEGDEEFANDGLLYSVEIKNEGSLPLCLDYAITGEVYGQLLPPALEKSPYLIDVIVSNGSASSLVTTFELEVLPVENPEDAWCLDESLDDELEKSTNISAEEERELFKTLQAEAEKEDSFSEEKLASWEAILRGQSTPELQALIDRPISHQDMYYLLGRMAHFVLWNANDPAPAGELHLLHLEGASEHFNVYNRGACLVATPKHLFDHNRTLLHAVRTAQAMAREVFNRGWQVEFGGFDKMVRAAWVELELLSKKFDKRVDYSYFMPSPQDHDSLKHAQGMRL